MAEDQIQNNMQNQLDHAYKVDLDAQKHVESGPFWLFKGFWAIMSHAFVVQVGFGACGFVRLRVKGPGLRVWSEGLVPRV